MGFQKPIDFNMFESQKILTICFIVSSSQRLQHSYLRVSLQKSNFVIAEKLSYFLWCSIPDESLIKDDTITMAIQVNGKTRGTLEVAADISKDDFLAQAKERASVKKHIEGKQIIKEIYIPGKICNLVAK